MGFLDWLRGGERAPQDSTEERAEVRGEEQSAGADFPETAQEVEQSAVDRRNEEASRHTGI